MQYFNWTCNRPLFFRYKNVLGGSYRNMLIYYAFQHLRFLQEDFFQQESAPPPCSDLIYNYLNNKRRNNWIERGGPVAWPAHSPDLTLCDFLLWGLFKPKIYSTPTGSAGEQKNSIRADISSIIQDTLTNVWDNTEFRLKYKMKVDGGHIENIMN